MANQTTSFPRPIWLQSSIVARRNAGPLQQLQPYPCQASVHQ